MIITDIHVQQILRAYSKQLSSKPRIHPKEKVEKNTPSKDQVTLSSESRKMWMVEKIAKEIIFQLTNGGEQTETTKEILNRLSEEYGYPLEISSKDGKELIFNVPTKEKEGGKITLSPSENKRLQERLLDIAKTIIHQQIA